MKRSVWQQPDAFEPTMYGIRILLKSINSVDKFTPPAHDCHETSRLQLPLQHVITDDAANGKMALADSGIL